MSTAAGLDPRRTHRLWAAVVVLEVLVVAVTFALDFTVAGFTMAAVAGGSLALHRHGLTAPWSHHPPRA